MSKSLGSKGSWSKAKNPGFNTAQTYQEVINLNSSYTSQHHVSKIKIIRYFQYLLPVTTAKTKTAG